MEKIKSERQKMIDGELYFAADPELATARKFAREQMKLINQEEDAQIRRQLVEETFGTTGTGSHIEPTISFDYGFNIHVGKNFYANFNSIFLDICPITIGDNCMFGPNAQLYSATHPLHPVKRNSGLEYGKPITIGDNVWLGGGVVITPGVTLGDNVVVAAGSVVTKSFPDNCVIGGNPAKIIKEIELDDNKQSPLMSQRDKIDTLDKKIVALLEERMEVVEAIVAIKKMSATQILDTNREQEVLTKIATYVQNEDYQEVIKETYQGIMDASKHFQQKQLD
ncbi:chorismate mutase [Enterococcus sp. 7E2_DIV0204]|uniref:Chorismate mutase n=1 Tax=Candidatus Enterococcus lemimoniae TaxID=1834167 RepID=A0ABZ2T839_9ENTE|nr:MULTISPECIES: chorismate mutase [unclassified Enterococcus]OTN88361.1 chorismate mutase [Enterococcus sp. 7E2_DIV0204]OTO70547.1 chorismate mutase [Enterococcus sp. 12C11_DIV0727]OTP50832.1 chorismate mutase [Enterococcus sp. 7D2_DIV0200]